MPLPKERVGEIMSNSQEPESMSMTDAIKNVFDALSAIVDWFKDFPEHMTTFVTTIVGGIYELINSLILKTPLWIFDNTWFENTTYLMSIMAVGVVSLLTMVNGIKQKIQKKHTDLKTIAKRWFLVAGISSILPIVLYKSYQLLNFLSETIMDLGVSNIKNPITPTLSGIDLIILAIFGVVMVGQAIPLLLKNGKRFFQIMCLSIIAPLAGVAYIFDSHKHLFQQWWSNLWNLSLIQVVYAFFLLVIGLFLYGIPTPDDFTGIATKMLIAIGGFMSLIDPPHFVSKHLWNGDATDIYKKAKDSYGKTKKGFSLIGGVGRNVVRAAKFLSRSPQPTLINSSATTRMGRKSAIPIQPKSRMIKNHGKFRRK